jgi:anthranilate synthase component 2
MAPGKQKAPSRITPGRGFPFIRYFASMRLLIIDNFDSFTYNLAQLFAALKDVDVVVRRNNTPLDALAALQPDALCISPGPGSPADSGVSREALRAWTGQLPVLGVCLGMQVINEHYGGATVHAPQPVHGKADTLRHSGAGLFRGLPSPFRAARYHSLAVRRTSDELIEDAWTGDGTVMALRHATLPVWAVQFHPESFLTEHGRAMAENFLALGGLR